MIIKPFYSLLEKYIKQGHSPKKLAFTVCLGIYIGLSPFIGCRMLLAFLCAWFFAMDIAILFAASLLIHNPWTVVPLYALNHVIGQWIFGILNIDGLQLDPSWVEFCSMLVQKYTGISGLSLSAFLVGGNLLGVSISVMLYPLVKQIISLYMSKKTILVHENNSTE